MKSVNVSLRVQITQVAEIPDNPPSDVPEPSKPFNDDPLDKQEKIMTKYLDRLATMHQAPGMAYTRESESAAMNRSVRVQAETFEDLSAILQKFSNTLKEIPEVDGSLLKVAVPTMPATPSYG
jgi:hypothetical protein